MTKRMTIVAAFLCSDGSVLCADTQETIGYEKINTDKIIAYNNQYAKLIAGVAGAGDSIWIDRAMWDLVKALPKDPTDFGAIENAIRNAATIFFDKYIRTYADNPQYYPDVKLLIIIEHNNISSAIFKIYQNVVSETGIIHGYDAIGAGDVLFRRMADDLFRRTLTMRQAASIAIYIMDHVKKQVLGCGGNTDILLLGKDCKIERIPTNRVKEIELRQSIIHIDNQEQLAAELIKELP